MLLFHGQMYMVFFFFFFYSCFPRISGSLSGSWGKEKWRVFHPFLEACKFFFYSVFDGLEGKKRHHSPLLPSLRQFLISEESEKQTCILLSPRTSPSLPVLMYLHDGVLSLVTRAVILMFCSLLCSQHQILPGWYIIILNLDNQMNVC